MRYSRAWRSLVLTIPFFCFPFLSKADEIVVINFHETNVLNGTGFNTGIPLTFSTGFHVLSIAIDWLSTGTPDLIPNGPFPLVYGDELHVVLGGTQMASECGYIVQTGPSSFGGTDCATPTLQGPFVSSVTYSGNWGSAEIGFVGTVPITIDSTFTETTITPEPGVLPLIAIGFVTMFAARLQNSRIRVSGGTFPVTRLPKT